MVKNRVHAAGNQTFLPIPATFKLRCYELPLGTELDRCQSWPPYSIHISKTPPFGASDYHLCFFLISLQPNTGIGSVLIRG